MTGLPERYASGWTALAGAGLAALLAAIVALGVFGVEAAWAQSVSLTTVGSAYTQNFDTLSNTAGSTTNDLTIPGWEMTESGGGARDNEQYAVDTGGSTTGDTYSYGAPGSTERALGGLRGGTLIPIFGASFTNNTGSTITSVDVAYAGEEWRLGTAGRTDQLSFEYSTNATSLETGTWAGVPGLNFVTPDTATVGAKNGNAAASRTTLSASIAGLSVPTGATVWIRWTDQDATGADDGLAVDDFSLTPQAGAVDPNADLAVTKTDGTTSATPGGSTTYTITASNAGPSNAPGATVADTFPASLTGTWTCVGAGGGTCTASGSGNINDTVNLPAGGSVTYTVSAVISSAATGSLSNTASVAAPAGVTDPTPGNNSATDTDTLAPQADLAVTKTDGTTSATPGGSTTYTITASNAGPSNAPGATVADTFPASLTGTWTCVGAGGGTCTASGSGNINDTVNLPAGGSVTYTVSAVISSAATGSLSNTASVAAPAGVTDPTPGNNSATDTDTLAPQADLAVTKTDGTTSATPGGSTTYTITASNAGPSNAPGATVADTFPASLTGTWTCVGAGGGTCTASGSGNINDTVNLPAGGSVTYTVSAVISSAATGSLSNTASVAAPAGVTDPTPSNNSATDSDALRPVQVPPSITSATTVSLVVGTSGSFTIRTTGVPIATIGQSGSLPAGLQFRDNGDGTATISGTPAPGTHGDHQVTITASNGQGSPARQTLTISIGRDAPPTAASHRYVVNSTDVLVVAAPGLLSNSHGESSLTARLVSTPRHGGAVSVMSNGSFSYRAKPGFVGIDTFTYAAVDIDGGTSAPATVSLTVKPPRRINHFTVSRIRTHRNGTITFRVKIPGPGTIDVLETAWNDNRARAAVLLQPAARRFVFARQHRSAHRTTTLQFRVTPNARGKRLVRHHTYRVTLRLWISYTPTGGHPRKQGFYGLRLPK